MSCLCLQAFEEAELPKLKEEKPGLTHNQYKDMIWKLWKKSPDNPLNQVKPISFEKMAERFCHIFDRCWINELGLNYVDGK